jgi:hypothetical protein
MEEIGLSSTLVSLSGPRFVAINPLSIAEDNVIELMSPVPVIP